MPKIKVKYIVFVVFLIGALLRINSFHYNKYLHADVTTDSAAAESFAREGSLRLPYDESLPFFYSFKEKGGRFLDQHPPLCPILGGAIIKILNLRPDQGFLALKILSLLSGILLIYLSYHLTKTIINEEAGIFVMILTNSLLLSLTI